MTQIFNIKHTIFAIQDEWSPQSDSLHRSACDSYASKMMFPQLETAKCPKVVLEEKTAVSLFPNALELEWMALCTKYSKEVICKYGTTTGMMVG